MGVCKRAPPVLPRVIQLVHDPAEGKHDAGLERSPHAREHHAQSQETKPAPADGNSMEPGEMHQKIDA